MASARSTAAAFTSTPHHPTSVRLQELNGKEPDEAEPNDHCRVPETRSRQAYALQRNASHRGVRRLPKRHPIRKGREEIFGHDIHLGVVGVARPRHRDSIAHVDARNLRPHLVHNPGSTVPQRHRSLEPGNHLPNRRPDPLRTDLSQHLLGQIRPRLGLSQIALLCQVNDHFFCARTD